VWDPEEEQQVGFFQWFGFATAFQLPWWLLHVQRKRTSAASKAVKRAGHLWHG
jgi:hypothetical protein